MFHNYGKCVVYHKERTTSLDVTDYIADYNLGTVILYRYIGNGTSIITPTPSIPNN